MNEVTKMSRIIVDRSNSVDKLELKKLFIATLGSVENPTDEQKEKALKELEKPFEDRKMAAIVGEKNIVNIPKKELQEYLNIDSEKYPDWYTVYYDLFKKLKDASSYEFRDNEEFLTGNLVAKVYTRKNMNCFRVTLDADFMPIFWNLKDGYVKMLTEDVCQFKSNYTMILYQWMIQHTDKNEADFTTKQLKGLFALGKESYVSKGKFVRGMFEKKTIDVALKELDEHCKSINIFKQTDKKGNSKLYSKIIKNGHVYKYVIKYQVIDPYSFTSYAALSDEDEIVDFNVDEPLNDYFGCMLTEKQYNDLMDINKEIAKKAMIRLGNWKVKSENKYNSSLKSFGNDYGILSGWIEADLDDIKSRSNYVPEETKVKYINMNDQNLIKLALDDDFIAIIILIEREFGRELEEKEIELINNWREKTSSEIIIQALRRTSTYGKSDLKYTNKIIENWLSVEKNPVLLEEKIEEGLL